MRPFGSARLSSLILLTAVTLSGTACATAHASGPVARGEVFFEESFRVRDGSRLAVDLRAEAVVIETGTSGRATVTVEGSGRDARREFERRRFAARTSGGGLSVRTSPPSGWSMRGTDARFTVTIRVPRRFDVDVDLGSGSVTAEQIDGRFAVDTGSGSVRVEDVRGPVSIDTGSGSVRIGRVDGSLSVDTGSGSVAIDDLRGRGDVATGSGGVRVGLDRAEALRVRTGSGSVRIALPRSASADVSLSGSSVRVDSDLRFDGRQTRGQARGRIGRGGPEIDVSTGSGSVSLTVR